MFITFKIDFNTLKHKMVESETSINESEIWNAMRKRHKAESNSFVQDKFQKISLHYASEFSNYVLQQKKCNIVMNSLMIIDLGSLFCKSDQFQVRRMEFYRLKQQVSIGEYINSDVLTMTEQVI